VVYYPPEGAKGSIIAGDADPFCEHPGRTPAACGEGGDMSGKDEIEKGYTKLLGKIEEYNGKIEELSEEVRSRDSALMERMGELTAPLIGKIGLNMLKRGKQDTKGELYDTSFYKEKMIVLGRTDPVPHRPDDPGKKVDDQFCVLGEDGRFYELMYSTDGVVVDSYRNPLSAQDALKLYGYDIMVMLYRAMRDYLQGQKELLDALEKTIAFITQGK
jgi:hypothetical protein